LVAVSVTVVPCANSAAHPLPPCTQSIPAGADVTVPAPDTVTVSTCGGNVNVATTERASAIVTAHAAVPLHAPPQPVNAPVVGVAVSVTTSPCPNAAAQVPLPLTPAMEHEIPAGDEATFPAPLPEPATVSTWV